MQSQYYTYQEHYPNCYSLHRPDGTEIAFLQGDDALKFGKVIQQLKAIEYPYGIFKSFEHLLSVNIDCYDLLSDIHAHSSFVFID